jgi:hypothetical protein
MGFFSRFFRKLFEPTPDKKGAIGEYEIALAIWKEIRRGLNGYYLQNLYLPRGDGSTSEIDLLLISTKGLFLIESKNFAGYIFGDDRRKEWTVVLYAGKNWLGQKMTEKHKFYNPIWQNRSHEKTLKSLIGPGIPVFPLVVFSDRGNLMNVQYDASKAEILQTNQLRSYFANVRRYCPDLLSDFEVQRIYQTLFPYTQVGDIQKQAHIAQVFEQQYQPQKCPWCSGNLVLRTAKRGLHPGQQFWGCSNYPRCLYTRDLEQH